MGSFIRCLSTEGHSKLWRETVRRFPPSARFLADTVNVGPGERYDVIWAARRPGKWLIHCHIPHHTMNNNTEVHGGGGLMMIIDVGDTEAMAGQNRGNDGPAPRRHTLNGP